MTILIMVILIFPRVVIGQQVSDLKGYVLNSQDNSPVPYAHVAVAGTPRGTFTNNSGFFVLNQKYDTVKISISAIGFKTKEIILFKSQNIFLEPEITMLNEVIVSSKKTRRSKEVMGIRNGSICCYYSGLKPFYALKINNPHNVVGTITEITYILGQPRIKSNRQKSLIRVRIYECNNEGLPGTDILKQNLIVEVNENQKTLNVDLKEYKIPFLSNGVFIGIDFLGSKSDEGIMLKDFSNFDSHLSIALTPAVKDQPAITYRRNFDGKWENVSLKNEFQPSSWPNKVNALISAKIEY